MNVKAAVIISTILLISCPNRTMGFPSGAPESTCRSMKPAAGPHGNAQNSGLPYKLIVKDQLIAAGDTIDLELVKIDVTSPDFEGFIVQAREVGTDKAIGTFQLADDHATARKMSCDGVEGSSVTHNSNDPKNNVALTWRSPGSVASSRRNVEVEFKFTVVQSKKVFWVQQVGSNNAVVKEENWGGEASVEPEPEDEGKEASGVYSECAKGKGCFGSPSGCEVKGNCRMMATYRYLESDDKMMLQLHASGLGSGKYVAVGLSSDGKMGEDLVFSCTDGGSKVTAHWNAGKSNKNGVNGVDVKNAKGETKDGLTTCEFAIAGKLSATPPGASSSVAFDLASSKYFLLLAMGEVSGGGILQYHDSKVPSGAAIDLRLASLVGGAKESYLVQVHGILMVFAWVSSATCGMLIARYYKETWRNVKPLGKDMWFRSHQFFMGLSVALSFTSFWVIVAKAGFLDYSAEFIAANPHPAIGMSCIICAIIQPIMAFFRPHPGTDKRWIFDWSHWFVGNAAFLFAVVALFLAVDLNAAQLPEVTSKVLIAFVVIHVLAHLTLTGNKVLASKLGNVRDSFSVNETEPKDTKGTRFRKGLIVLYFLFVWCLAIALCFLIFNKQLGIDYDGSEGEASAEAEAVAEASAEGEAVAEG